MAGMIAVHIPEALFHKLKRTAELTHRSVEDVTVTSLEAALPVIQDLPSDVANELAAMHLFSDEALWAATAPSLSPTEEYRLNQLNTVAGERVLTPAEETEQQSLITAYHRSVLRRAQALAILAQRGHRIPVMDKPEISDHDKD
ncbi:MAG: hypothetical protein AB7G75_24985 [Candidatus Binatia bacterium]